MTTRQPALWPILCYIHGQQDVSRWSMPWSGRRLVPNPKKRRVLACLTLALAYVVSGRLGLLLAVPPGYATAIFPPAGIAMAAVLSADAGRCRGYSPDRVRSISGSAQRWSRTARRWPSPWQWRSPRPPSRKPRGGWVLRKLIGYPATLDNVRDLGRLPADHAGVVPDQRHTVARRHGGAWRNRHI